MGYGNIIKRRAILNDLASLRALSRRLESAKPLNEKEVEHLVLKTSKELLSLVGSLATLTLCVKLLQRDLTTWSNVVESEVTEQCQRSLNLLHAQSKDLLTVLSSPLEND